MPRNPDLQNAQPKSQSLAWACMRYNWTKGAFDAGLNQFTPPEKIVDFVSQYPGMYDACFVNPDYLALYAPPTVLSGERIQRKAQRTMF